MTSFWSDNLRRLMSQYKFKVDNNLNHENLFCSLCQNLIMDPYQSHCGCQYCHACIAEYLADGEKFCQGGKEGCQEECLMIEKNVSRSSILEKKLSKVKVHCPKELCQFIAELKEMEDHLKVCKQRFTECPYTVIGCDTEGTSNDKIMTHLDAEKLTHSTLLIRLFNDLKNEFTALREIHTNEKIEDANLKRRLSTEVKHLKDELNMTKTMIATARPNVVSFTVTEFNERKISQLSIYSPYFYSHTNGYKLRLCVIPGGLSTNGTNMAVFVEISMGKYDDVLPWPCKRNFNISLINQRDGLAHKSLTFHYGNPNNMFTYSFHKPTNKDSVGSVGPIIISHVDLQDVDGLLVDDAVIVQCGVSDSL